MKYKIIKNDTNYNLNDLTKLLNTSYWAKDRKKETVKKTVENSLCYFAYDTDKNKLIGFARAITDYTTNYYKKFYEKFGFYNKEDVMQKDKK